MLLVCRPFSATKKRQCLRISLALHVVCISSFALHSPHAARLHTINSKTTLRSKGPAISIPHDVRSYNLITESLRPGNAKSRTAASSPIHRTDTSVKSFFLFAPPFCVQDNFSRSRTGVSDTHGLFCIPTLSFFFVVSLVCALATN